MQGMVGNWFRFWLRQMARTARWRCIGMAVVLIQVCGLLLAPASAQAAYVTAKFTGVSPGKTVSYTLNGSHTSTSAGYFNWTTVATDSALAAKFTTFCIELTQFIHKGDTYTYNLVNLENAPNPGNGIGGKGINGPMGAAKADLIRELWGRYYSQIGTNAGKAAAFQIAIWEIVFDGFVPDPSAYATQAQTWLNTLNGDKTKFEYRLIALSNANYQDEITILTPLPASFTMIACGLLGAAGYRWRRRNLLA